MSKRVPKVDIDPIPTGAGGIVRGTTITVKGKTSFLIVPGDGGGELDRISEVAVQLGASGTFETAKLTGAGSRWHTDPLPIVGAVNDILEITARVSTEEGAEATDTVFATVDRTPPVLTTPDPMTQAVVNGKTTFQLAGTARDDRSPVVAVEWVLGQGQQFTLATPKAPGDWSSWTAAVQVSPAGTYQLLVRARDGEGNITPPKQVTLHAVETFQPRDPSDVFNLAAYLDDLVADNPPGFAKKRIVVDAQNTPLDAARLKAIYKQHFADVTNPNNREAATAPVHQVRVCVEVLRAFLAGINKNAPAAEEAKYRQGAYAALLRNLGTSFDEIRRARGDEATRARLADRLGVDRPDRLDQLVLLPEQITEANLDQLFGLQDTSRDPLVRGPRARLLTWQLDRLRAQWQDQDNAARVYGDIRVPIIDPDILVEADFRTRNADADPAFALRNARTAEMAALLKQIDDLRKSESTALAGFDAVVGQFVAKVEDIRALLADYQAGKDIVPTLTEKRLSLAAFLRLMRSRDLAIAETVLDADWADVYAIAAQVTKLGRYPAWRTEEQAKGLTLGPDYFVLPDLTTPLIELPEWRATLQARRAWQATLQTRINQQQEVIQALRAVVDAAEANVLPGLRDVLVATAGDAARGLLIDLSSGAAQRTSRLAQAIETLQGALFAVRVGAFTADHPAAGWKPAPGYTEANFDADWVFWGSHETWQGAMRVFIYPESHLLPTLRPVTAKGHLPPTPRPVTEPTNAYKDLIEKLRSFVRITPDQAREAAKGYLAQLRAEFANDITFPQDLKSGTFVITEQLTDKELADRQAISVKLMGTFANPHHAPPSYLKEVFYFVPLLCALQLQRSGEYLAALDWFQTVYAYHLPPGRLTADKLPPGTLPAGKPLPDRRQIYYGLTLDEQITTQFQRPTNWPREGLNPHDIVRDRANALTRFVVISLVRCFEQFADAEFTRDTDESVARARALYQTALDLLGLAYPATGATAAPASPFGLDPVVEALRLHADSNLRKLRLGRNIAGLERQVSPELAAGTAIAPRQPTPYRYAALIARAKEFTQNAAQMEAALLAALEKHDAESYNLLKAIQDVELASETVRLQDLRVVEAVNGIRLAALQEGRARFQFFYFVDLLQEGVSGAEKVSMFFGAIGSAIGGAASGSAAGPIGALAGGGIGLLGSLFGQMASFERRKEDWELQLALARHDSFIGIQQMILAKDQVAVATQEQRIARLQMDHAGATVQFLAGKFTSAELYEFMSEVLDGIYRFFLQQATAMAKLAENQLAFERQEPPLGVIQGDYYAAPDGGPDRRGMTGSARLLADIVQLDQHAFLTDRRKLQLTKTLSLARLAPIEFARFRETGVMVIGTPQALFDRDFPGHYLRLVKRVRMSVIALIPPTEGIRATLSTPGTSRVVIGGDTFRNVVVRRDPETVGLSSPRDATGLFELVPDSQPELLLPFEGTGVDTVWRLELPKAANPFDYSTIADVLLTLEYTALNSFDYREQVIQTLDPELSIDRPFSFRQQFPDQWYDLHNPDQAATPMTVRFKTARGDYLPNLDDLKTQHLVLYLAPANGQPVEMRGARLLFKKQSDQTPVGGSADSIDGVISTRRANGSNWLPITGNKPPVGEWELALPTDDTTKNFFRNEQIEDILFAITYSGRTPAWPT
jgi:Tc toxin complex TcA C-terminal TcB-binding domain